MVAVGMSCRWSWTRRRPLNVERLACEIKRMLPTVAKWRVFGHRKFIPKFNRAFQ